MMTLISRIFSGFLKASEAGLAGQDQLSPTDLKKAKVFENDRYMSNLFKPQAIC